MNSAPNLLVVDDFQENLLLMTGILNRLGFQVRTVSSGPLALEAAINMPPDLILLDINMPGMSGFEVCERLKAFRPLADIPVIFLSALNETVNKVRGFLAGGVDYITKPFDLEEVHARVACQLRLRQLRRDLEERNRELAEAHRMHDNLLHMLVHDMRAPLTVQLGFTELLLSSAPPLLGEDQRNWAAIVYETSLKLNGMVSSLLDISRMEAGKMPINRIPNDLTKIVQDALEFYRPIIAQRRFVLDPWDTPVIADCDEALIQRVLENLIGNAVKFTKNDGSVFISITRTEREARISVTDDGPGIAPEHHETIFAKFGQADGQKRRASTGIGLAFCRLAIEAQGGRIWVESEVGKGSTFWFTLPQDYHELQTTAK